MTESDSRYGSLIVDDAIAATDRRQSLHGMWSNRMAFVFAVTGSAVGLGNIWKFPYITGENGGGAFVLVYLLCVFAIGLPVMMSEVLIGRRGRRNPIATMRIVGEEEGGHRSWQLVGAMGVFGGFLILSYYSVIAGWAVAYIFRSVAGTFSGATAESVAVIAGTLKASPIESGAWHTVFMAMTVFVVARGVQRGLERAVTFLMPALMVLLVLLLVYSMFTGAFAKSVDFMFGVRWDSLTPEGVLIALGHAFFTLSVGMGAVMAYGAYLPEGTSITNTSITVVVADTVIALLAGLIVFSVVFNSPGLEAGAGPTLIFQTLPLAFSQMPAGIVFGTVFFLLLTFAAWTSGIGLVEPAVAWVVESRGWSRMKAASVIGIIIWLIGFGTVFSDNLLKNVTFLKGTIYQNVDFLTSNIMLPLGGLLIVVFAGWVMCRNSTCEELDCGTGGAYKAWRFFARFIAPAAVILVFIEAATGGMVSKLIGS